MSLVDWLLANRTPLELAKALAQEAHTNAALKDRINALEVENFWLNVQGGRMVYRKREDTSVDFDASGEFFNTLKREHNLKTEKALAAWLEVSPSYVSKVRHGIYEVPAEIILYVHEKNNLPVKEIRRLIMQDRIN